VATGINTVGVLVMLAGVFEFLPGNLAMYLGIACFVVAGAVWSLWKQSGPGAACAETVGSGAHASRP
jgi:hypothetical protein